MDLEGYWNTCALFEGDVVVQRLVALEDIDGCRDITRIIGAEGSTIVDVAFVVVERAHSLRCLVPPRAVEDIGRRWAALEQRLKA